MVKRAALAVWVLAAATLGAQNAAVPATRERAAAAMRKAAEFYSSKVATEGGYHYYYADDLSYGRSEHGEGPTQIEVQREATPIVALAYLKAWDATGDRFYLEAAQAAARALVRGQLCSGGWDYIIEFDPVKRRTFPYRSDGNCAAKSPAQTTLDDNVTQAAVRVLMRVDQELEFRDAAVHEAALFALDRLVKAQYPNGAWPQRFTEPPDPAQFPVRKASYPDSWPRAWPGPNYRAHYTFNDNAILDMIDVLLEASRIYKNPLYQAAAEKGAGFILLAQMPEPQPAWAQQYDLDMHPAWARAFEPPSVTGGESQSVLKTLLMLYRETGNRKYLDPVAPALAYLQRSLVPPGGGEARRRFKPGEPVLARFYELRTNRPLYVTKGTRVTVQGRPTATLGGYELSYTGESVITHYGVLVSGAGLPAIDREYQRLAATRPPEQRPLKLRELSTWNDVEQRPAPLTPPAAEASAEAIVAAMDGRGAWVEPGSIGRADRVVSVFAARDMVVTIGDRTMPMKENETLNVYEGAAPPRGRIIRSETFARNLSALASYLAR